ncbi:MAG TPA: tRNA 2-selenouridine(34) synthase MnmH [Burkholderiaceae bacterium]|nr:tRNA 2-selenouridine(34) synthase MnmH [Burkholderiaceae bacterium]
MIPYLANLEQLAEFDEIVDVRTPAEFEDDHIPGALNAPVLDNAQRAEIGTLYKTAPFDATRRGAAMVAHNIARHLDTLFADRPRQWRPLVYCWRGGKRSGSMTAWFNLIGWRARQLEGGYKTYRRHVLQRLDDLPGQFHYVVLTGSTGSGKTRLLHALAQAGAQTLDLEGLSRHRGSLLGAWPGQDQPSQKTFESALAQVLSTFDPGRPVFVEAESRRIGQITLPTAMLDSYRRGACVDVQTPLAERIGFLLEDYAHLFSDKATFKQQLGRLAVLHGNDTIARWHGLIDADAAPELFRDLITRHYDPAYARSTSRSFGDMSGALAFEFHPCAEDTRGQADALLARVSGLTEHI